MAHFDLASNQMVALTRASLAALRAALMRDAGQGAAAYLQEAGYAGGEQLFASFRDWLRQRGGTEVEDIPLEEFERLATEFFREGGWGSLQLGTIGDAVATLDSADWGEADPAAALEYPGCHLTTGMFADFFGRIAQFPMAVLEVECRSAGASRCRFLLGNAEVMEHVYEGLSRGETVEGAVDGVA